MYLTRLCSILVIMYIAIEQGILQDTSLRQGVLILFRAIPIHDTNFVTSIQDYLATS